MAAQKWAESMALFQRVVVYAKKATKDKLLNGKMYRIPLRYNKISLTVHPAVNTFVKLTLVNICFYRTSTKGSM